MLLARSWCLIKQSGCGQRNSVDIANYIRRLSSGRLAMNGISQAAELLDLSRSHQHLKPLFGRVTVQRQHRRWPADRACTNIPKESPHGDWSVLGLDRLVARANNGFVSNLYEIGEMTLYVNNGHGALAKVLSQARRAVGANKDYTQNSYARLTVCLALMRSEPPFCSSLSLSA